MAAPLFPKLGLVHIEDVAIGIFSRNAPGSHITSRDLRVIAYGINTSTYTCFIDLNQMRTEVPHYLGHKTAVLTAVLYWASWIRVVCNHILSDPSYSRATSYSPDKAVIPNGATKEAGPRSCFLEYMFLIELVRPRSDFLLYKTEGVLGTSYLADDARTEYH